MSNETKAEIMKAAPNRWPVFCILTLSGRIAFKLSSMKDMFYMPMQEFMGLTNTQTGGALSAYVIVQTVGLIGGIYSCDMLQEVCDRRSQRRPAVSCSRYSGGRPLPAAAGIYEILTSMGLRWWAA